MKYLFSFFIFLNSFLFGQSTEIEIPYIHHVLPNGLNLLLHEDHSTPTVAVNVWYHVGSANEKPGRTGFAHLFEHLMFEGSGNVPEGMFDNWLEAAGGQNNGSTNNDRTNYWENIPSNALELALFLESDRMGYLLDDMTPEKVDGQRNVVKNERRQSYENQPYGLAWETIYKNLYPVDHPYNWTTIGSMEDLSAASYEDVVEFFKLYYAPNNASLSIAGDIDTEKTIAMVEKWFGEIPRGKPVPSIDAPPADLSEEKILILEDKVQLPRLYVTWITPAQFHPGDAELDILSNILTGGKNSRLYQRLVYDLQIAQDVSAFQSSGRLSSQYMIIATARAGHSLDELMTVIEEELSKIKNEAPEEREIQRAVNQYEASFLDRLQSIGGFGGKADLLNRYLYFTGNPDYFNEDLERYKAVSPKDILAMTNSYLPKDSRVILSIVPEGETELAIKENTEGK